MFKTLMNRAMSFAIETANRVGSQVFVTAITAKITPVAAVAVRNTCLAVTAAAATVRSTYVKCVATVKRAIVTVKTTVRQYTAKITHMCDRAVLRTVEWILLSGTGHTQLRITTASAVLITYGFVLYVVTSGIYGVKRIVLFIPELCYSCVAFITHLSAASYKADAMYAHRAAFALSGVAR